MAKLRVFVSSTCYDLNVLRSELRPFIQNLGFEPVMSEYSDILYDPRTHTHDSCLKEIPGADVVVLIIGSRFGGTGVPSASLSLDFEALGKLSAKSAILENKDKLSVTQLEVLKAVEQSIPIYVFVEEKVLNDHHVYEKNKGKKDLIEQIEFPSIQRADTARYIFEFINFLGHRVTNNSITGFARLEDIRIHLTSQWSQLFQRLLSESRTRTREERKYRDFSESIDDLKAVVLASLATPDLRETAKGAIQFRHLINFLTALRGVDHRKLLLSDCDWDNLLNSAGVTEIRIDDPEDRFMRPNIFLIKEDRTFYWCRYQIRVFDDFRNDWSGFIRLELHSREAIVDALLQDKEARRFLVQYIPQSFEDYQKERQLRQHSEQLESADQEYSAVALDAEASSPEKEK